MREMVGRDKEVAGGLKSELSTGDGCHHPVSAIASFEASIQTPSLQLSSQTTRILIPNVLSRATATK